MGRWEEGRKGWEAERGKGGQWGVERLRLTRWREGERKGYGEGLRRLPMEVWA